MLDLSVVQDWRYDVCWIQGEESTCDIWNYRLFNVYRRMLEKRMRVVEEKFLYDRNDPNSDRNMRVRQKMRQIAETATTNKERLLELSVNPVRYPVSRTDKNYYVDLAKFAVDIHGDFSIAYYILKKYMKESIPTSHFVWIAESSSPSFWKFLENNEPDLSNELSVQSFYRMLGWCATEKEILGVDGTPDLDAICRYSDVKPTDGMGWYNVILGMNPRKHHRNIFIDRITYDIEGRVTDETRKSVIDNLSTSRRLFRYDKRFILV